jgi:hypothetical protein
MSAGLPSKSKVSDEARWLKAVSGAGAPSLFSLMNECRDISELRRALAIGADPRELDAAGNTTLMWAALQGLPEFVEELLPLVDPKARNEKGADALRLAVIPACPRCVAMLLRFGQVDGEERVSLDQAMEAGIGWGQKEDKVVVRNMLDAERARREALAIGAETRPGARGPRAKSL